MNIPAPVRKIGLPLIIVAGAIGVYILLSSRTHEEKRRPPRPLARVLFTDRIHIDTVFPHIETSGRIQSPDQVTLTPEVSGKILPRGFRLRKSTQFRKDATLLQIDARLAQYSFQSSVSDLLKAVSAMLPELKTDDQHAYDRWHDFFITLSDEALPALVQPQNEREKLIATRYAVLPELTGRPRSHGKMQAR